MTKDTGKTSPFESIRSLLKNEPWDPNGDATQYSPWLTNKYFSNSLEYSVIARAADKIIDPKMNRAFWEGILNNTRRRPIDWIKNPPERPDLTVLMKLYKINAEQAVEYRKLMPDSEFEQLQADYQSISK